jgi:hypothetical protein
MVRKRRKKQKQIPDGMTTKEQTMAKTEADPCGMTTKRTDNSKEESRSLTG